MSRGERLQPVAELARREADQAAEELAEVRTRIERERGRLTELENCRDEYGRGTPSTGQCMQAGELQGERAFAAQLNEAILEQEKILRGLWADLARAEEKWREKRARAEAMDHVIEGYRADERRRHERQEQAASDEHAALHRSKGS